LTDGPANPCSLCAALARVTDSRPMQYRIAQIIAQAVGRDEAAAEVAIVYAVEKGWLIAEGNRRTAFASQMRPHSVGYFAEAHTLGMARKSAPQPPRVKLGWSVLHQSPKK
jgi:hypothetical protein